MSAHQTPPYYPTLVNLRTAPWAEIDAALRHWRGWRLTPALSDAPRQTPPEPPPANAELPGMWEQADFIDTSEAPAPAPDPMRILAEDPDAAFDAAKAMRQAHAQSMAKGAIVIPTPARIPATDFDAAYHANNEALRRVRALTPGARIPADAITGIPTTRTRTRPTPTQRPPAPSGTNETDFPGMALPVNADKRLTEAIRLIALANKAPDNDSAIGHTLRALAQVISTIALPRCCEGGPQWGHAWTCDTLP